MRIDRAGRRLPESTVVLVASGRGVLIFPMAFSAGRFGRIATRLACTLAWGCLLALSACVPALRAGYDAAPDVACGTGMMACNGSCISVTDDPANCGGCARACLTAGDGGTT